MVLEGFFFSAKPLISYPVFFVCHALIMVRGAFWPAIFQRYVNQPLDSNQSKSLASWKVGEVEELFKTLFAVGLYTALGYKALV